MSTETPAEVPDELIGIAYKAFRFSDEQDTESALAAALAAVLPVHEKQVRAKVAEAIADVSEARNDEDPGYVEAYWDGRDDAANIARGAS